MTYYLRLTTVILLITFHCSLTSAQNDSAKAPRPYIGVSGGIGLAPRALFYPSSTAFWMDYVKPGFNFNIAGGIPLWHKGKAALGVTAMLGYYGNTFDMKKFMKGVTPDSTSATYTQGGYSSFSQYSFLAGVYGTYTLGRTTLLLRAVAGGEYLTLPNVAFNINYPPPVSNYSETIAFIYNSTMAFAFGGGLQVGYVITKNLSLTYSSDVLVSYASYNYLENVIRTSGSSIYPASGLAHVYMFNATLGLCYSVGH